MESIITKKAQKTGSSLAVFCGVHGNETAGINAVKKAIDTIDITKGEVHFVFANPRAIEQGVRYTETNLNRCFLPSNPGESYEQKRALELMKLLDDVDALLDLHSSNTPDTKPFIITDNGLDIAKSFDFEIAVTGFDDIEPGATDGYMRAQEKVGLCLECGYSGNGNNDKNIDLAYQAIVNFLRYFGSIPGENKELNNSQKHLHVDRAQKVTSEQFRLSRTFADFATVPAGTLLATDQSKKFITEKERVILFANSGKPVGAEAYILGSWVEHRSE